MATKLARASKRTRLDARSKKLAKKYLAFVREHRLTNVPRPLHHSKIRKELGNIYREPGRTFFNKLLSQVGTYEAGKTSYKYVVKPEGVAEISELVGETLKSDAELAHDIYGGIVAGTVAPVYSEPTPGARRYHPVQLLRKDVRRRVFCGYRDYDIQASAVCIMRQYAEQRFRQALQNWPADELFCPGVLQLIQDKDACRHRVRDAAQVDQNAAKEIPTALFFLAQTAPSKKARIFGELLQGDRRRLEALLADPFVDQFRRESRIIWTWARDRARREGLIPFADRTMTPSERQVLYQRLERRCIDAILESIGGLQPGLILMHDGFMTRADLDVHEMEEAAARAGFNIRISCKLIGQDEDDADDLNEVDLSIDEGEPESE